MKNIIKLMSMYVELVKVYGIDSEDIVLKIEQLLLNSYGCDGFNNELDNLVIVYPEFKSLAKMLYQV